MARRQGPLSADPTVADPNDAAPSIADWISTSGQIAGAVAATLDTVQFDATESTALDERDSLEFAIAVWSVRSRSANNTVHALTDTATALGRPGRRRPDAALNTYALLQAHLDNLDNTLTPEAATTALALRIRDNQTQQLRRSSPPRSA